MLEETGCDAIMIGRAALGNPWLFAQVNAYLEQEKKLVAPQLPRITSYNVCYTKLLRSLINLFRAFFSLRDSALFDDS